LFGAVLLLITAFQFFFGKSCLSTVLGEHENFGDLFTPFPLPLPRQPLDHSNAKISAGPIRKEVFFFHLGC
jgi:hypothetical protein